MMSYDALEVARDFARWLVENSKSVAVIATGGLAIFCATCRRETPHKKAREKGEYVCVECDERNRPIAS